MITIAANAMLEVNRNMMTICRRAACSTDAPPRMAPDIVPGMDMIPITLMYLSVAVQNRENQSSYLIALIIGIRARRRPSMAMGLHASNLVAPKARYISTLSRFSLNRQIRQRDDMVEKKKQRTGTLSEYG